MTGLHHLELWVPDLAEARRSWGWLLSELGWTVADLGGTMFEAHHDDVYLEPGFQIRVFLSANVALSFSGGIVIGVADTDGVSLAGQTTGGAAGNFDAVAGSLAVNGGAGVHYYFN